jgi:transposase InsO family protein
VILDLFSRMVVGWAMAETSDEQLVELALRMAFAARRPPAGLVHHSDRGSEFTSERDLPLLREAGCEVSMSRTGTVMTTRPWKRFLPP